MDKLEVIGDALLEAKECIEALQEENLKLKNAIKKYGCHIIDCENDFYDTNNCSCGFSEVIKQAGE